MKIMLVEDDRVLAGEIGVFLKRWGYETLAAEEFERIGEEFSCWRPQLVLMDINLPFYARRSGRFRKCRFFLSAAGERITTRLWLLPRAGMIMWRSLFGWSF